MPMSGLPGGDSGWLTYVLILLLSIWGGFVNYLGRIKAGVVKRFDLIELVGEFAISSFSGLLFGLIALSFNADSLMAMAIAGVAGHAGARAVYMLNSIFESKLTSLTKRVKKP